MPSTNSPIRDPVRAPVLSNPAPRLLEEDWRALSVAQRRRLAGNDVRRSR
jgi:hypothetical protein